MSKIAKYSSPGGPDPLNSLATPMNRTPLWSQYFNTHSHLSCQLTCPTDLEHIRSQCCDNWFL